MSSKFPAGFHPAEQPVNQAVLETARRHGVQAYLVGGYVRDSLMGLYSPDNKPDDFDYAISGGSAIEFARLLADKLHGHFVLLDEALDTARVVLDTGEMIDCAGCVGGTIESDVKRRDFSVNALVWNVEKPDEVMDLVRGLPDLQTKTIRAIDDKNFDDDPLRLLRAYRFAAAFGGTIDSATQSAIQARADALGRVAQERVSYELFLIMECAGSTSIVKDMGSSGLLEVIFPELSATRKVTPNAYHHLGLWDHSIEALAQAEGKLPDMPDWAHQSYCMELSKPLSRLGAAKIACLLHDIGKPETWVITPEGRHSFYGHDRLGADMAEGIAKRMRWSKPVERLIVRLIRWHLRPGQLFHQGPPTSRAIHRFYRTVGNDTPELMLLAFGDLGATCGPGLEEQIRKDLSRNLHELLDGYDVFRNSERSRVRLLDGNQIMQILDVKPGPILGECIQALEEAQALHEVSSHKEAMQFVREWYQQKYRS
jgi:putative nucleotidyltransferase with HDIG domain